MRGPHLRVLGALFALVTGSAAPTSACAEDTPAAIVARATDTNSLGFDHGQAKIRMVLKEAGGSAKERSISARSAKEGGLARTLIRFLSPSEVQGSAFLLLEQAGDTPDDMYLYLPALKRTRRISGNQKDGAFMGSDFSYADMENRDAKAATYVRKPDAVVDGVSCYDIVAKPTAGDTPYGRLELLIRQDNNLIVRTDFFDKADAPTKTYAVHTFKLVDGRPVATEAEMKTQATGHTTVIFIDSIDTQTPASPADFTPDALSRG